MHGCSIREALDTATGFLARADDERADLTQHA